MPVKVPEAVEATSNEGEVTEAVEATSKEEVLLTQAATVDITKIKAKTKVVTRAMTKVATRVMEEARDVIETTGEMVMKVEEEVVVEATIGTEVCRAEAGNRNNNIELKFKMSRVFQIMNA